jgi:hypothetical protein
MWAMWAQFGLGAAAAHAGARVEMGEAQFIKLLRECALLDKEGPGAVFTSRHADLVHAKVKPKVGHTVAGRLGRACKDSGVRWCAPAHRRSTLCRSLVIPVMHRKCDAGVYTLGFQCFTTAAQCRERLL